MDVLIYLIPASLALGALGLAGFLWTLRHRQYDDPEGDKHRILSSEWDDRPKPDQTSADTHEIPNQPKSPEKRAPKRPEGD